MASVNKAIIVGTLGKDPEVRYMSDGSAVANLSLATSSQWKDKATGEKRQETEWHKVVFYGRQAEITAEYCKKGRQVYIEGRLRTRKWQDQSGADRYTTEIVGDVLQLLGSRDGGGQDGGFEQNEQQPPQQKQPRQQDPALAQRGMFPPPSKPQHPAQQNQPDLDDDIPF